LPLCSFPFPFPGGAASFSSPACELRARDYLNFVHRSAQFFACANRQPNQLRSLRLSGMGNDEQNSLTGPAHWPGTGCSGWLLGYPVDFSGVPCVRFR